MNASPFSMAAARALVLLVLLPPAAARAAEDSWKSLFDGKTLAGWVQYGGKAGYRAEDGMIIGTSVTNTPNSFLCTRRDYTNFILEVEFNADPGVNSGVQFRSQRFEHATEFKWKERTVKVPAGRVHGLQAEIDTSSRAWSAGLYEEGARGWLKDLKDNEPARKAFKPGDWNHYRIEARGDSVKTWINGIPAAEISDSRVPAGFIGLQVHGIGKRTGTYEIRFRKVRIQEL